MTSIYDVPSNELIERTSTELKKIKEIEPPVWSRFVKTGRFKERPPVREDWWYIRAASILRRIYKLGPIGVSKLRTKYGGKKDRGHKTEHVYKGSGNIPRKILQQLERAQLIMYVEKGTHKGRIVTSKGKSLLDRVSAQIYAEMMEKIPTREKPREKAEKKIEIKEKKEIKKETKPQVKSKTKKPKTGKTKNEKVKDDNTGKIKKTKTGKTKKNAAPAVK